MNGQDIINVLLGVAGFFGVYILKSLQSQLSKSDERNTDLADRLAQHEKFVAGNCIQRQEFEDKIEKLGNILFAKLDKIYNKLDSKADK